VRCLVLSPHYDDAEIACGGLISKFVGNDDHPGGERENNVRVMVFSAQRRLDGSNFDTLRQELEASSRVLNFDRQEMGFESRTLWQHRQEVLDALCLANETYAPDVVVGPSLNETHQDHQVLAEEAFRAFKFQNLIAYDLPWNIRRESVKTMFVELGEDDVREKVRAVACYKSQQPRDYLTEESVWAMVKARGLQCGKLYAESFEVYRWFLR
jgi:LmbE family N-acetylglucosaminyl deacetylase